MMVPEPRAFIPGSTLLIVRMPRELPLTSATFPWSVIASLDGLAASTVGSTNDVVQVEIARRPAAGGAAPEAIAMEHEPTRRGRDVLRRSRGRFRVERADALGITLGELELGRRKLDRATRAV